MKGFFFCYARLKPGVTLAQARADVQRAAAEIAQQDATLGRGYTARLDDLHADAVEGIRPTLLLLLAAAGVLLLITCANVAGLLLTRAVARARETAVRVALGAGNGSLALQYFLKGIVVSANRRRGRHCRQPRAGAAGSAGSPRRTFRAPKTSRSTGACSCSRSG